MNEREQEFRKRLLSTFKVEAAEHVQALSSGLVALENALSSDDRAKVIETVFRGAHSLKGAARAVGLAEIESICQAAETVFSALKQNQVELSPALSDALDHAIAALEQLLLDLEKPPERRAQLSVSDIVRRLESVTSGAPASPSSRALAQAAASVQPSPESRPPLEERSALAGTVRIATANLDALLYEAEELVSAKLTTSQRAADLRELADEFATLKNQHASLEPAVKALQQTWEKARGERGDVAAPHAIKLLEFIAWQADFGKSFQAKLDALARSAEYDQRAVGSMVDGLRNDMKQVLMLPISSALEVLPRLVRDLARDQHKEVDLAVSGTEIQIDRRILDEVRDPLIHLVRNSIDHGIETPEVRTRAGKPARGRLAVAVVQKDGSKIEIRVSDDGAGIDVAKVQDAARKLGIAGRESIDQSGEQGLALIFQSGLSTSPYVTDISGRGLGLAIVAERVERLGGSVSVQTGPGRGTDFRMLLPVTLATFRGVHVRVNGERFVVPTTYVEQALRLKTDAIRTVKNRETIRWNGETVALVRLADVLELHRTRQKSTGNVDDTLQAIILSAAGMRMAFGVDRVLSEQEVLVKKLGKPLSRVRNIAGATVLPSGKAIPILNVPDLLRSGVKVAASPVASRADKQEIAARRKSILVAEDSITSRALLKNILESAGYDVTAVVDGMEALTRLRTEAFDLVVSDVEMPRLDGFELTAKIRADSALAQIPVVLVTGLESREHRERGAEAGANAYIVKSSFDQSNLLQTIRRLV